jgi:type II secretory pathway pseudopilin PulG
MRNCRLDNRRGAVLLETLVALAVLAIVGSAAAWTASESIRAVGRVYEAEAHVRLAVRLLTAASLWPREDLDRHLGTRAQGPLRMRVDRLQPTLYEVSVMDGATGSVLLRTSLYRLEPDQ